MVGCAQPEAARVYIERLQDALVHLNRAHDAVNDGVRGLYLEVALQLLIACHMNRAAAGSAEVHRHAVRLLVVECRHHSLAVSHRG